MLSFGENFLKRQYGLNPFVFWSKFSEKKVWVEPYIVLIKIFQKDYNGMKCIISEPKFS